MDEWELEDEATLVKLQWAECDASDSDRGNPRRQNEAQECAAILANLHEVRERVQSKVGKLPVSGRYHRLPRRMDDDYHVTRKSLGKGTSGEVRLATRINSACTRRYAVKSFRLAGIPTKRRLELEAEVEVYLSVDHPHIARLVDVYETESHLYLVMECMQGGELLDRLNEIDQFAEKDAAEALYQMLLSVNYLHSLGIVHRDIKADNFLYDTPGGDRLKLIDFGLCAVWETGLELAEICGTLSYVAPEVLHQSYTSQCDLWSLGVIAYLILSGKLPFKATGAFTNQMKAIEQGAYDFKGKSWRTVSDEAKDFISGLLEMDPAKRFDAEAALQHGWLACRKGRGKELEEIDSFVIRGLRSFGHTSKFRQACMSMMVWSMSNDESEVFRKNFLRIDKSHNGRITFPELLQALRQGSSSDHAGTSGNVSEQVADFGEMLRIFSAMDANGDWRVQYGDFLAAMMSTHLATATETDRSVDHLLHDAFNRFDVDRSGDISVQDLEHVLNLSADNAHQAILEADPLGGGKISYPSFARYALGRQPSLRSSL